MLNRVLGLLDRLYWGDDRRRQTAYFQGVAAGVGFALIWMDEWKAALLVFVVSLYLGARCDRLSRSEGR